MLTIWKYVDMLLLLLLLILDIAIANRKLSYFVSRTLNAWMNDRQSDRQTDGLNGCLETVNWAKIWTTVTSIPLWETFSRHPMSHLSRWVTSKYDIVRRHLKRRHCFRLEEEHFLFYPFVISCRKLQQIGEIL